MNFICLDGKIITAAEPVFMRDNRSFRYGDGLFETLKMINGRILLKEFHFERLFTSLHILQYRIPASFTDSLLEDLIKRLAEKNNCTNLCRVRLTVFRGNGNLYPDPGQMNYSIECNPLDPAINSFNEQGYSIGIYPHVQKSCDLFSNVKSASFLPYVMGALYAEENKLDDCLLTNTKGSISDATMANIFLIHSRKMSTPALTEGCINGVIRKYLLGKFRELGYECRETEIHQQDLLTADELFLTNAIHGIRWVKNFGSTSYSCSFTRKIYDEFIKTIFQ
jgi:branched-chain amino acid aminotransferase